MVVSYPAIVHKEEQSYWLEFPDLPGCQTYGYTLNQTMEAAMEALGGYLLVLLEEEKKLPAPSEMDILQPEDGFTTLVVCNINQYKDTRAVKKTLTIPAWLNDMAVEKGINFSKVLQDALLSKIQAR